MSAYTASYGVRCVCLRLTNVYGPGMQAKDSIVARLMRAIRLGRSSRSTATAARCATTCTSADVIAAMKIALVNEDWHGPMVIGSGKSLSVLEVVDAVRAVTGASLDVRHGPARPGEMPAVIVDPSRALAAGWSPRFDFATGSAACGRNGRRPTSTRSRPGVPAAPSWSAS